MASYKKRYFILDFNQGVLQVKQQKDPYPGSVKDTKVYAFRDITRCIREAKVTMTSSKAPFVYMFGFETFSRVY